MAPNSVARSSLEKLLDSLQRRDENEKPSDMPPILPARPRPTSRARLPSPNRRLPTSSDIGISSTAPSSLSCNDRREVSKGSKLGEAETILSSSNGEPEEDPKRLRHNSSGSKVVSEVESREPLSIMVALEQKDHKVQLEERDNANAKSPPRSSPRSSESKEFDNVEYSNNKKLRVWCRVHNGLWETGQIQSISREKTSVLLTDGRVLTVSKQEFLLANPDILEGVDDLMQLSYLNEPSILYNLQNRYFQDLIYSKAGPLLLALNPFKDIRLYGNDFATAYRKKLLASPHVYAVADRAYNEMLTNEVNQSIIISGESGAGKTETAKVAIQYLAFVGTSGEMESEILQTSCILEAFGNAKTARNDNSSRFGKLIEIYFSASGEICGAKMQTYLLEKSRVVQLAQGERSYHIFYQLCAGAPDDLRDRLRLKRASDYSYLNQSGCLEIHGVDDAKKFHALMGALDTLRFDKDDQVNAFEMLAAVLWLGNISFVVIDDENHIEAVADEAVANAAALIGCGTQELMVALSMHSIVAGKDNVAKRLTQQQAIDRRDYLAKFIYASLFDWLVEKINASLAMGKEQHTGRSISILDIYGFESFKKNGFEQFCINYANERLQQLFNRQLFKLPQEEYELDGIDWIRINFKDNQDCLDLFEKQPHGLISLLDDESKFPKATDLTLATKLKQHWSANRCFKGEQGGAFRIRHYAGEVLYDTHGFLQQYRDSLHSEIFQLLLSCTSQLLQLFASMAKESQKGTSLSVHVGMLAHRKPSFATKFKDQLKLMQKLESTTPHFIRCIKPNSRQIPGAFEKDLVLGQLRCCGIVEVVRISKSGYATQMTHQEFTRKYGFLIPENNAYLDPLSKSIAILQQFDIHPEMYQVGFRNLYFRAGQISVLEKVREQVLQGELEVQKCFWGHCAHRNFHELVGGIVTLQSLIRGWLTRRHFSNLQQSKQSNLTEQKPSNQTSQVKDLQSEILPSIIEELQKQVSMAEVTLGSKEKENVALKEQLQRYEAQWSEFDSKMKSMEEMWQKQVASLQTSLDAARKSLVSDNTVHQPGKVHSTLSSLFSDSEDTSLVPHTPGRTTPARVINSGNDEVAVADTNDSLNPVSSLAKEFEQRKQNFEEAALAVLDVRPEQAHPANLREELQRLKHRYQAWSKDFKVRLKEAKAKILRGHTDMAKAKILRVHTDVAKAKILRAHTDVRKPSWKWWAKKSKEMVGKEK